VAVVALTGTGCAHAQNRGNFEDADTNKDGHLRLQEFEAYATKRLTDGSGRLARRFQKLTLEQQTARLQQRFRKLDRDHKGCLDKNDRDSR
jgi:Ca2+-binding EF-hand superfamily protein